MDEEGAARKAAELLAGVEVRFAHSHVAELETERRLRPSHNQNRTVQ